MKKKALVLTSGAFQTLNGKTAHGLVRGTDRFEICGVVDGPELAGQDAGTILDGQFRGIPVYAELKDALDCSDGIVYLIIGVATEGGILPEGMKGTIREAILAGLSIVNGLHDYLSDQKELSALAVANGVELMDIRKPKQRKDLHFWTGEIYAVDCPIVAVLGMDCGMGKRTTAKLLAEACREAGFKAEMIYTGQTGWLQGGKYGFIFDSTLNDFVSGELEHAIVSCWKDLHPAVLFLEGQSALRNPSGPCGAELLLSGNARKVVLVHAPKRQYFDEIPSWGAIPAPETEIALIHMYGSEVIALALNTAGCTREEAFELQSAYQKRLGIPVLLPLEEGVQQIVSLLGLE